MPLAHANDGGGSIRIPAAACGLVGLKPSRGRLAPMPLERVMPLNIANDGVVSRTVRDTAHLLAAIERRSALSPVGLVEGPSSRRLRIGLVIDSPLGPATDAESRTAVLAAADLLASLGHAVEEVSLPIDPQFAQDFSLYWGFLGFVSSTAGARVYPGLDRSKLDNLTLGLADYYRARRKQSWAALRRLRKTQIAYAQGFLRTDVLLTPVVGHVTPLIGHLSPTLPFDELFARLTAYVTFTPLNNAAGAPAVSLPLGKTSTGLPIGVQLAGPVGDERTLLELSYELEAAQPFRSLARP